MSAKWRIFWRPSNRKRKLAERGVEYDGSRWNLHKSYDTENAAKTALAQLQARYNPVDRPFKSMQFKLIPPGEKP